ncbi:LamG domain-containing protein, partial [Planctomycetota bacterium]
LAALMEYWGCEVKDLTLAAHWKLDEVDGIIAYDSASVNDAVVVGGTEWQPSGGQVNGALQLNGVDGCAIAGAILNPADGPFSVLAWINGGAPGQVVVSQQNAANWLTTDAEGNLMTELKGAGRSTGPLFSETVITDDQWHRIGLVWDGSNRTLYVDGVVVAEDTQPGLEGSQMGLYLGVNKNYAPGTYFSGLIDDVRIYNRAVSP